MGGIQEIGGVTLKHLGTYGKKAGHPVACLPVVREVFQVNVHSKETTAQ